MIDEIRVQNLALISSACVSPSSALTVLTGETGAGKTALLSALKLLSGERADASCVREGEECLVVEGRFYTDKDDAEGTVVSRRVSADGRSRVSIDGAISSVKELNARIGSTIDLCGQHEHQRLLNADVHVSLIDRWAADEIGPVLTTYQEAFEAYRAAQAELERVRELSATQTMQVEQARFTLDRIEQVNPFEGELEELEEVLPKAEHAESLVRLAYESQDLLSGDEGALNPLNSVISEMSSMTSIDPSLSEYVDQLASAAIIIEDVASDLRKYRESIEFDPESLQEAQERRSALYGLLRTYGPRMEDVFSARDKARELIDLVDNSTEALKRAQTACDEAEDVLVSAAAELTRVRNTCAPKFCAQVAKQMARLEMGTAELVWDSRMSDFKQWTKQGSCSCELLYRSAAGLTPRPMKKIASGGELSRLLLAIKVVMGEADYTDTLVFDEVDSGVGGATALSLAAVLKDLSSTHQVIVVTHLPQVCVAADTHYVVRKDTSSGIPQTKLVQVEGHEREIEIARMLSGDASEASLLHAREMLSK